MVTDTDYRFTSPAGRECILASARFAAVNPSSRVLNLGCGFGAAACLLAKEFRCRVEAVDPRPGLAEAARKHSVRRGVSHLISIHDSDPFSLDFSEDPFDLIIIEGNFLHSHQINSIFQIAPLWLQPRGWVSFSDLVFTVSEIPPEIRLTFGEDQKSLPEEENYQKMIRDARMDLHYIGLVPPSGWDNYYTHMAQRLADRSGYYSDPMVKSALHREIDTFYRHRAIQYLGYLFCITRMKN
ncbi:MAG: SAM-dependent methyltransferase [Chitinispirillaceae bacterium]